MQTIITNGSRAVVINAHRDGGFWAALYVNARNGILSADITNLSWSGQTLAGAKRWAAKQVAA